VEDCGPGIPDVAIALTPGFSTHGGYGFGLSTVHELATSLDIDSRPGRTRVQARFVRSPRPPELRAHYVARVVDHVETGAEEALVAIEQLGRALVDKGLPFEKIADMHEAASRALYARGIGRSAETISRMSACLAAVMMSSAIGFRGRVDLVEYDRAQVYAERARQRLETLGQLIGGMAHEVSNLLQPVVGLCELTLLDMPEDAPERDHLGIIADCAARASGMLRNVLAYGRFVEPEPRSVAFGAAVQRGLAFVSSVSMLWPTLTIDIADTQSRVTIVEDELTQILLNLIQNAAQAHAKRIEISLTRTLWRFPAKANGAPTPRRPALRLAVADDGDGMDAETLIRASIPFFSGKPKGEGSGMGLAVVGGIVKSWSGQLTLNSRPGAGATISIYVPIDA
jgi:signal transduction histidine kinase